MNCIQIAKVFYYYPLYYNRNTLSLNPPEKTLPPPPPPPLASMPPSEPLQLRPQLGLLRWVNATLAGRIHPCGTQNCVHGNGGLESFRPCPPPYPHRVDLFFFSWGGSCFDPLTHVVRDPHVAALEDFVHKSDVERTPPHLGIGVIHRYGH